MPGLAKVSMFPYSAFWRIDGQGFMKNSCGGIATVLALVILLVISILKFYEVFKMTTIIATSSTSMNLQPPMTNISTTQNDPSYMPYMIGFGFYKDFFYDSSNTATAEYVVVTRESNGKRTIVRKNITLENCTADHFSVLPNITQKATEWSIGKWMCLPINKTYQIGGSYELSSVYKRIQINVTCDNSENKQDCGYVKQYTLNAAIDPTSANASTYFLSEDTFIVKAQASYSYSSKVNKHSLIEDSSLLPTQKLANKTSTDTNTLILQQSTTIAVQGMVQTVLKIEVSGRSTTYNRSYLKLVDALAYIGGIFNSILAIFFFIEGFNRYFFEMRFANQYFKTKQTKNIDFITYIKASLYPSLVGTRFQPKTKDWTNAGKHGQIKTIVNKLLDVIYLNKRIAFLEQAISVVFEKHQLKGLHLMHSMNTKEAEENFHKHRLRQRLIYFIHKTQKLEQQAQDIDSQREQNDELRGSQAQQKVLLKSKFIIEEEKMESETKNMKGLDEQDDRQQKPNVQKVGASSFKTVIQSQLGGTSKNIQGTQIGGIINQADWVYKEAYTEHSPERDIKMREHQKIIKRQVEYIGKMEPQDLKESELVDQLETDLRKLMEEAEDDKNKLSSIIYSRLEDWLKDKLKHAIKQQQEEGKFSKLRKTSKIMKKKDSNKSDK